MRAIPIYLAFTCAILALFLFVEALTAPSPEGIWGRKGCWYCPGCFLWLLGHRLHLLHTVLPSASCQGRNLCQVLAYPYETLAKEH